MSEPTIPPTCIGCTALRAERDAANAEVARLRALLARVQVEDRWRTMQDAADWEEFLGWRDDCGTIAVERVDGRLFTDGGREDITDDPPTHARPIPLTPAEEAELDALRKAVAMEGETP